MATRPMRLRLSAGVQDAARRVPALGSLIERSLKTHLFVFQRQGGVFSYDVIPGTDCAYYPATTSCPSSIPASPGLGYDSRTIGADMAKINAATSGVIVAP